MLSTLMLLVLAATPPAEPEAPTSLRIVLFTPADLEPPAGAKARISKVADTAERFLATGMTRWNYEAERANFVRREADGSAEVLVVKGANPKGGGRYEKPDFAREVIDRATAQYKVAGSHNVWWIFTYLGDRPTRFGDYRGHGDSHGGGWAIVNYDSVAVQIRPEEDLGSAAHEKFTTKGCIHELGHALGLPHIGPNPGKKLGLPLMGPNLGPYRERYPRPREPRVYLTEAAAAMLWKHPLFSGVEPDRSALPKVELADYKPTFVAKKRQFEIAGKLVADRRAHSVVVLDDGERQQGSYWSRSYVARLKDDGTFRVVIDEPWSKDGVFRIVFCFDDGTATGDGKGHGDGSAIVKAYRWAGGNPKFDP